MTELPDDLRALLNLTRDAHDPTDPEARTRVRHAIAASLLISGGAAGGSVFPAAASNTQTLGALAKTAKAGWALFGSKLSTVAIGAVAAAGLTYGAYSFTQRPANTTPTAPVATAVVQGAQFAAPPAPSAPVVAPAPAVEPAAASTTPDEVAIPQNKPVRTSKVQPSASTLSPETGLLRSASEALARGDETAALAQLREHGRRFRNGSLREERDGLRAIAECSRDDAPSSASAKRFLRRYPSSLLGARVAKACAGR